MNMEEPHAPCAYEGANGVNLHFVAQPFRQLLDQILRFTLMRIDMLFPSFGIIIRYKMLVMMLT
jgi:hypothetical protein